MRQQVSELELGGHGGRASIGRQEVDERVVESDQAALDQPERGGRGRQLRDRCDPESRPVGHRHAVAAVGQPAVIGEDRLAGPPDLGDAAEQMIGRALVQPRPERVEIHGASS